ncbi:nucleotidyltransferase domain-containing protein [Spongorhabdus nitratireducens]
MMNSEVITHSAAKAALKWITDYLHQQKIPYLITGGLAAIAYGSKRPLADIDMYIPAEYYAAVLDFGADYISQPSTRYQDENWDLELAELNYEGQLIEICKADNIRMFNQLTGLWEVQPVDFDRHSRIELMGLKVAVMSAKDLIGYKQKLGRPVDLADIAAITT